MIKNIAMLLLSATAGAAQSFGPPPALTTKTHSLDAEIVEDCLSPLVTERIGPDFVDGAQACVGKAARQCLEASDRSGRGMYDNRSYANCYGLESRYWAWRLKKTTEGLRIWAEEPTQAPDDPAAPANALAATLDSSERYRDARCRFDASDRYGTAEAGISRSACRMRETAEFAIEMEFSLRVKCDGLTAPAFSRYCAG